MMGDRRWVKDDMKPYYPAGSCLYVDKDINCHLNKRPYDEFVKWKWQPFPFEIPRFSSLNATEFLERLRGKKIIFIGDSVNRNMWESLVCILQLSLDNKNGFMRFQERDSTRKEESMLSDSRNEFKREGAGRGNWGAQSDEINHEIQEGVTEREKPVASDKPETDEEATDVKNENSSP